MKLILKENELNELEHFKKQLLCNNVLNTIIVLVNLVNVQRSIENNLTVMVEKFDSRNVITLLISGSVYR